MSTGFNHYHVDIFAQSFATTGGWSGLFSHHRFASAAIKSIIQILLGFSELDLSTIRSIPQYIKRWIYESIIIIFIFMLKVLLLPVAALAFLLLPVRIHIFPFFAPNKIYTDQENRKNKYNQPTLIWDSNPHFKIIHTNMMRTGIPRQSHVLVFTKYFIQYLYI